MTSTAYPFGMIPTANIAARSNTQGFESLDIADGYATSIFFGDVVKLVTAGTIEKDTGTIALTPYGVAVGFSYADPGLGYWNNQQYWPASTTTSITTGPKRPMVKVCNDPNAVFMIQADATLAKTAVGANAAIVQTAGGTTFGKSKNALSASSVAVTATLPLRILGLAEIPDNAWDDEFPIVLVKFTNHALNTLAGI